MLKIVQLGGFLLNPKSFLDSPASSAEPVIKELIKNDSRDSKNIPNILVHLVKKIKQNLIF